MEVLGKNFFVQASALLIQAQYPQPNYELEVRFGYWENSKFKSTIKENEYKLLMEKLESPKAKHSLSAVWLSSGTGYRTIFQIDPINRKTISKTHQKKEAIAKQDFPELGVRISIKKEVDMPTNPQIKSTNLIRLIDRYSFEHSIENTQNPWRIDLSKVATKEFSNFQGAEKAWNELIGPDMSDFTYELEIEYIGKQNIENIVKGMANSISYIKDILIPDFQFYKLRKEIFRTIQGILQISGREVDFRRDLTDNPISLRFQNLGDIETNLYSATEKADGTRKLLWIDENNMGYFLTSANDIEPLEKITDGLTNCLIDGEDINGEIYATFDMLIENGKDVRAESHKERLELLQKSIKSILSKKRKVIVKKFYFPEKGKRATESVNEQVEQGTKRIYDLARKVLEAKYPYKIDGIIFTPVEARYKDPHMKIYKWKPPEETTIDFLIRRIGNNQYQLFVGIHRDTFKRLKLTLPKNYRLLFPTIDIQKINYFPVPFYPKSHYENGKEPVDNVIAEFSFNKEANNWKIVRIREDRTAEYRKYGHPFGNDWETAMTNWEIITQPITEGMITGKEKIPFFIDKGSRDLSIQAMKKFHNYVKFQLYSKYVAKTKWLLEIASGRMGDLQKWIEVGVKNVLSVDIDADAIQEGRRRIAGLGKVPVKIFDQLADFGELFQPVSGTTNSFDNAVCNFAVHFFMGGQATFQQFVENVDKYLKKGGYLVITSLDGRRVNNFFEKNKIGEGEIYEFVKDGKRVLALKKLYKGYALSDMSQEMLSFVITIGSVQSEYLVNFEFLKETFKAKSYKVVEDNNFEDYYSSWLRDTKKKWGELSDTEKQYSFMNRALVLLKS